MKIWDNLLFIHKDDIFPQEKKNTKFPPSDLIHLIVHLEFQLHATSEPNGHWKKTKQNKLYVNIEVLSHNANTELPQNQGITQIITFNIFIEIVFFFFCSLARMSTDWLLLPKQTET